MRLEQWIADLGALREAEKFRLTKPLEVTAYSESRAVDLYYSLVGKLFEMLADKPESTSTSEWSDVGKGLELVSREFSNRTRVDSLLFAAVAFYRGGYPAYAFMVMKQIDNMLLENDAELAVSDMMLHPNKPVSRRFGEILENLRKGRMEAIDSALDYAVQNTKTALTEGPDEWISNYLYEILLRKFKHTNVREVLPNGASNSWDTLVDSFIRRRRPVWSFFPSQIKAIEDGILERNESYSIQMPTGSGKTTLMETLIYNHLRINAGSKIALLVPYRSLARELRNTLGENLKNMGIGTHAVYGGAVPSLRERQEARVANVIIATPEAMTGLLDSNTELLSEMSLIVCDEGHLLDGESRGVCLELLLAHLKTAVDNIRIIFLSAVVPNIDDINQWLGGTSETVVKSDYRATVTEYGALESRGNGVKQSIDMKFYDSGLNHRPYTLVDFLSREDFRYTDRTSGRSRTFRCSSKKTKAVAAARKALLQGPVAIFSMTKRGDSGAEGVADEILKQIACGVPLPKPVDFSKDKERLKEAFDYLQSEFGESWIVTRALYEGVVVHHGDIPQEAREILEDLLLQQVAAMVICTSTLSEGVNLPIRTMVLYSLKMYAGPSIGCRPMFARDISNLLGRTGRPGLSSKGLVICVDHSDWEIVKRTIRGGSNEPVVGALTRLVELMSKCQDVTNQFLESDARMKSLVDGIDSVLIEYIHEEIGADEFSRTVAAFISETYASRQLDATQIELLGRVSSLRRDRLEEMRTTGRLAYLKDSAVKPRILNSLIDDLLGSDFDWCSSEITLDLVTQQMLAWAMKQPGVEENVLGVIKGTRSREEIEVLLRCILVSWVRGESYSSIAERAGVEVSVLLNIHSNLIMNVLLELFEQAAALLRSIEERECISLASSLVDFAELVRYGVPSALCLRVIKIGVRCRRAAVELGVFCDGRVAGEFDDESLQKALNRVLCQDEERWRARLGNLVYRLTVEDLPR